MSMPDNREHEVIMQYYGQTTTDKINKKLSEAEQRILQQVADVANRLMDHDQKINEQGNMIAEDRSFIARVRRAFSGVVK